MEKFKNFLVELYKKWFWKCVLIFFTTVLVVSVAKVAVYELAAYQNGHFAKIKLKYTHYGDVLKLNDNEIVVLGHHRPEPTKTESQTLKEIKAYQYTPFEIYDSKTRRIREYNFKEGIYFEPNGVVLGENKILLTHACEIEGKQYPTQNYCYKNMKMILLDVKRGFYTLIDKKLKVESSYIDVIENGRKFISIGGYNTNRYYRYNHKFKNQFNFLKLELQDVYEYDLTNNTVTKIFDIPNNIKILSKNNIIKIAPKKYIIYDRDNGFYLLDLNAKKLELVINFKEMYPNYKGDLKYGYPPIANLFTISEEKFGFLTYATNILFVYNLKTQGFELKYGGSWREAFDYNVSANLLDETNILVTGVGTETIDKRFEIYPNFISISATFGYQTNQAIISTKYATKTRAPRRSDVRFYNSRINLQTGETILFFTPDSDIPHRLDTTYKKTYLDSFRQPQKKK